MAFSQHPANKESSPLFLALLSRCLMFFPFQGILFVRIKQQSFPEISTDDFHCAGEAAGSKVKKKK